MTSCHNSENWPQAIWEQTDPGAEEWLYLKQSEWHLSDHHTTNFKIMVRADYTVFARAPFPVYKSSCPLIGQWRQGSRPLNHLPVSEIKQTFLSTNPASLLAFEQRASGPLAIRSRHTTGGRTLAISGSHGFLECSRCHDTVHGRLWGTCCSWLAGPEKGAWGDILAAAETICFEDPPCFSPAWHWLPTYFPLEEWKRESGQDEALQDPVSPLVCTRLTPLLSMKRYLGILSVGSDVCLPLGTVWKQECHLGIFATWFWPMSNIEDPLWAVSVIWFWYVSTTEDHSCWGGVCLGLHTGHLLSGSVTVLSSDVWVYIYTHTHTHTFIFHLCDWYSCCLL